MYILEFNAYREIEIQEITNFKSIGSRLMPINMQISIEIQMPLQLYVNFALEQLNLKVGQCPRVFEKGMINFLYAETLEQATLWKDWVNSRILMNSMSGE